MLLKSNVLSNACENWFKTLSSLSSPSASCDKAVAIGRLVILSGPSGAGKSTVVRRLLTDCDLPIRLSVSATTRPPRPGELEGREYHFVSPQQFEQLREQGAFLEFKEVFGRGHWYGTLRDEVASGLQRGEWVILEIDVQGALTVLAENPDCLTIFLHPGGMEELERRLRERGTESTEAIERRLEVARQEWDLRHHYRHHVVNDSVTNAVRQICQILQTYRGPEACSKS
jgi:guanylate kinase